MIYDGLLRITFTRVARVQACYIEKRARREAGTKTVLVGLSIQLVNAVE
jgi:hypothetical protein